MCELGQQLREAREARGLSLSEVAELLKMRKALVEALEECRFELLPEPPLTRGYIRRYAQLLGLQPEPLLALYPSPAEGRNRGPLPPRNPTLSTNPTPSPRPNTQTPVPLAPTHPASSATAQAPRGGLAWLWAIPIGLAVGLGILYFTRTAPPTPSPMVTSPPPTLSTPPAPRQVTLRLTTQPAGARVFLDGFLLGQAPLEARIEGGERTLRVEAQGFQNYERVLALTTDRNLSVALTRLPTSPESTTPASPTSTQGAAVSIRMDGRSWIRVTNPTTGQELYEGIPASGAQLSYPGPVLIRAGNAGAVRVFVNGQDRGLMGREGQVLSQRYGP